MNNRRVLVVSNDHRTGVALESMLADATGDLDIAYSSACALECVNEREYDIAIIDESLETNRGQELFEQFQGCQTRLKGILCSECPTVDTVEAAIDAGMDHVVKRPVDQAEIVQLVQG